MSLGARRNHLPAVYQICRDSGWVKKKATDGSVVPTHTVLDAGFVGFGPIVVPNTNPLQLELFYSEYAKSWDLGERLYFVEKPQPNQPHRLYFDFDMYFPVDAQPCPVSCLRRMFVTIQRTIYTTVFPRISHSNLTMLVGSGGWGTYKKKFNGEQIPRPYTKLGLHLTWRDLFVESSWLMAIRAAIVTALESEYGNRNIPLVREGEFDDDEEQAEEDAGFLALQNTWDDVVDRNVAMTPSSRMFGSRKLEKCVCKKQKIDCTHDKDYRGNGQFDAGRMYKLATVVNEHGVIRQSLLDSLNANKKHLLFAASLIVTPSSAPPTHHGIDLTAQQGSKTGASSSSKSKDLPADDAKCVAITQYIKISYDIDITKFQFCRRTRSYTLQTSCRRCFNNYDQEHTTATSYLTVSV